MSVKFIFSIAKVIINTELNLVWFKAKSVEHSLMITHDRAVMDCSMSLLSISSQWITQVHIKFSLAQSLAYGTPSEDHLWDEEINLWEKWLVKLCTRRGEYYLLCFLSFMITMFWFLCIFLSYWQSKERKKYMHNS